MAGTPDLERLACPVCHGPLAPGGTDVGADDPASVRCTGCAATYPVVDGVPVLLAPGSAFDVAQVASGGDAYYPDQGAQDGMKLRVRKLLPGMALDQFGNDQDRYVRSLVIADHPDGGVAGLVVGAGRRAPEYARRFPEVDWLVTDVEPALGADAVGDVLQLPLPDASVDVVLAEHVLEHVVDPIRAGAEIERVLRPGGIVFAKVPFTHPWHGGYVDFFRFTPAGFLAALPSCEPLHVGHGPGPMSAVAYLLQGSLTNLFTSRRGRMAGAAAGRLLFGWLKHLDRVAARRPGSLGVTMTVVFVGRRGEHRRSAGELLDAARRIGRAPVGPPPVGPPTAGNGSTTGLTDRRGARAR